MSEMAFEITAKEIAGLDPLRFVDFANHLILAECDKLSISPAAAKTSSEINVPDEGIDARIDDGKTTTEDRWIPSGLSVWQFKTGKAATRPGRLAKDAAKLGVISALKAGGHYTVAIGIQSGPKLRKAQEKTLRTAIKKKGLDPDRVRLLTADNLMKWASEHPSISLLLGHPIGNCMRQEDWERIRAHHGSFVADEHRQDLIRKIRDFVRRRDAPVNMRVLGHRGAGKTRLVMEALKEKGIRERVVYAQQPEDVPSGILAWVKRAPVSSTILVVDECDPDDSSKFRAHAEICEGRMRLLTIGVGEPFLSDLSPNHLFLDLLGDQSMSKILEDSFRSLPYEQRAWIVRVAGGYPRLGVACAEVLSRRQDIDITRLTRAAEIHEILDIFLPDPKVKRIMQALSLLTRVGFEGEVIDEAKLLANFVEVQWSEFCDVVNQMHRQGLVGKKGRYRYVTPGLLAAWLAADIWSTRTDEVRGLLDSLTTPGSRDAFYERLKDLGTDEKTEAVIRSLLSERNFPSTKELNSQEGSKILCMLAFASPPSALSTLERLLGNVPPSELRNFSEGRRNVVNALDYIKWFGNTFFGAARLLLALAEAENEKWSNNATGIWTGLFRVHLGGTEVPANARLSLLEEALKSNSSARRMLALKAIAVSMSWHEVRGSGIEKEGTRPVPAEWRPRKFGEIWEVYRKELKLVDQAMQDADIGVAREARTILIQSARTIVAVGLADEITSRLDSFEPEDDSEQRALRESIRTILQYESGRLGKDQREKLVALEEKLTGATYRDRLHRWIGQWSFGDWDIQKRGGGLPPQERAAELAGEALEHPELLRSELDWLVSDESFNVGYFGKRLGELDQDRTWLLELVTRSRGHRPILLGTYLGGRIAVGDGETVASLLDQWVKNDEQLAGVVLFATLNLESSKRNLDRILNLVQKGWIQREELRILVWSGWAEKLPNDALRDLLACLLADGNKVSTEVALSLLDRRLKSIPTEAEILAPFTWQALAQESAIEETMAQYYWGEVSKHYVQNDPLRLANTVLGLYKSHRVKVLFHQDDEPLKALAKATELKPKEVWDRVADVLLRKDEAGYRLLLGLQYWYVQLFESSLLLDWADKHRPDGPEILATLTVPSGVPLNELTRQLLIRYGRNERLRNQLYANLQTGSFTGRMSAWLRNKLETARIWSSGSNTTVSNWAKRLVDDLNQQIVRFEKSEEEEELA